MEFNIVQAKKILEEKLGSLYERAAMILNNYGDRLSFDVANVLMHAADKGEGEGKIIEILNLLEKHFNKHLKYQHPDVRGTVCNSLGINETQVMFLEICEKVLRLKSIKEQEIPNEP